VLQARHAQIVRRLPAKQEANGLRPGFGAPTVVRENPAPAAQAGTSGARASDATG